MTDAITCKKCGELYYSLVGGEICHECDGSMGGARMTESALKQVLITHGLIDSTISLKIADVSPEMAGRLAYSTGRIAMLGSMVVDTDGKGHFTVQLDLVPHRGIEEIS